MTAQDHLGYQFRTRREPGKVTRIDAHQGGVNAGYVSLEPRLGGGVWLDAVYAHPDHRGHGLGNELVSRAVRKFGGEDIHLHAQPFEEQPGVRGPDRETLMGMYAKHGFEPVDTPGQGRMVRRGR